MAKIGTSSASALPGHKSPCPAKQAYFLGRDGRVAGVLFAVIHGEGRLLHSSGPMVQSPTQ